MAFVAIKMGRRSGSCRQLLGSCRTRSGAYLNRYVTIPRPRDESYVTPSQPLNVTLRSDPSILVLQVKDNGVGIPTKAETKEGFGFVNMRARVKKLKGTLDIRTVPGRGTNIIICVPVKVND
jgi:Histidine kinase-, DNA gyrase B-, and HSP90-like ATPase